MDDMMLKQEGGEEPVANAASFSWALETDVTDGGILDYEDHVTREDCAESTKQRSPSDLREKLKQNSDICNYRESPKEQSSPQKGRRERGPRSPQSERDLRNRIGNRKPRDGGSSRPNYSRTSGGLSPLRSPHSRNHRYNIMEMDNSRCHRFTRSRQNRDQENRHNERHSTDRSPWQNNCSTPSSHQTVLGHTDSEEEGTPTLPMLSPITSKKSWSRRRLQLPEEDEELEGGAEGSDALETILEDDPATLARREKNIFYGKSTEAYKLYETQVPREERNSDYRIHPRTPQKTRKCSRRSWDAQVKIWKRRLHTWAGGSQNGPKDDSDMDDSAASKESAPEEDDSFLEDLELNLSGTTL